MDKIRIGSFLFGGMLWVLEEFSLENGKDQLYLLSKWTFITFELSGPEITLSQASYLDPSTPSNGIIIHLPLLWIPWNIT